MTVAGDRKKALQWNVEILVNNTGVLEGGAIADIPGRSVAKGDQHCRGFAIATSKFTGTTNLPCVRVVRRDDPAQSFADLRGSRYGYVNKSCSSSFFPANIVLGKRGERLAEYLDTGQVEPWQGQIDAVVARARRATMVAEDVGKTAPENARDTKIIGRSENARPALIVARQDLEEGVSKRVLAALVGWMPKLGWMPKWEAVFDAFRPSCHADVQAGFDDLNGLPEGI